MRTAVCNVATAPRSTVVSVLSLRALVVVVVVGCLLSGCLSVDGRPMTDVERTKLTADEEASIELRQRRSVDAVDTTAADQLQLLQPQSAFTSRVHAAIIEAIRERRRLRRDAAAAADKTTVTPPSGTPRKGYGSNSYWNRSGWGGGYGK